MGQDQRHSTEKLIVKFRQWSPGGEGSASPYYCPISVSADMKKLLLAGDETVASEVHVALFRADLLLIGNGLTHEVTFLEEKDLPVEAKLINLTRR